MISRSSSESLSNESNPPCRSVQISRKVRKQTPQVTGSDQTKKIKYLCIIVIHGWMIENVRHPSRIPLGGASTLVVPPSYRSNQYHVKTAHRMTVVSYSSSSHTDHDFISPENPSSSSSNQRKKKTVTAIEYHARGGTGERNLMRMLWYINESTKWVVSSLVFGILLWKRDETTAWCIIGGVITAIACRTLKFLINASRPSSSVKSDPGMPSSHASTLAFLSVFPSLVVLQARHGLSSFLLAWSLPMGAIFLTSLRVILGYHTVPQVVVGWMLGATIAYTWLRFGIDLALPYLMSFMMGKMLLTVTTLAFMALFAVKNVLRWMKE